MFAQTILIGRLTKDPESRTVPVNGQDQQVCNFTVATDTRNGGTAYHNIVVWRKLAETCQANLSKGRMVSVVGSPQTRTYPREVGGEQVTIYVHEVIADNVTFLDKKPEGTGSGYQRQNQGQSQQGSYQRTQNPTGFDDVQMQHDDMPF